MGMTVLTIGSWNWRDDLSLYRELNRIHSSSGISLLIHGGYPVGVDDIADRWCHANGVKVDRHLPNRREHGREAESVRDSKMLQLKPDIVLAFERFHSEEVRRLLDQATRAGIKVMLETEES